MPIYEYRCQDCAKLSSFFLRSIKSELEPACSHCEGQSMERCMSSFAMGKTVGSVHEKFAPGSEHHSPDYYSDPRNIGRGVEDTFTKLGMEMPPTVREPPKGLEL